MLDIRIQEKHDRGSTESDVLIGIERDQPLLPIRDGPQELLISEPASLLCPPHNIPPGGWAVHEPSAGEEGQQPTAGESQRVSLAPFHTVLLLLSLGFCLRQKCRRSSGSPSGRITDEDVDSLSK